MIRMSMNQLSTFSWPFDEDILRYSELGYEAVGVWRSKLSDYGEERGIELLREQQMRVSNLMWAGGFTGSDGQSYNEALLDAIEAIRLTAELKADCLVVYTGSRAGHTFNHARRMSRKAIEQLIPIAEEFGVTLAIEPVHPDAGGEWTFLHDLDETLEFLDAFTTPNLKLAFDTYHLAQTEIDLHKIESIARRVAIVHVADAASPPMGELNCCLVGEGNLPIVPIISALYNGGYCGYLDVKLLGEDLELYSYEKIMAHSQQALRDMTEV